MESEVRAMIERTISEGDKLLLADQKMRRENLEKALGILEERFEFNSTDDYMNYIRGND